MWHRRGMPSRRTISRIEQCLSRGAERGSIVKEVFETAGKERDTTESSGGWVGPGQTPRIPCARHHLVLTSTLLSHLQLDQIACSIVTALRRHFFVVREDETTKPAKSFFY